MVRRSWFVASTLLVAALVAGCNGSDHPRAAPTPKPTPIAKLDVSAVRLVRGKFCDQVPGTAVRRALGGDSQSEDSWSNGDPVPGTEGSGDVGHEIGCSWTGTAGASARAWVFARPVDSALAGVLVRAASQQGGCTAASAAVFGNPAVLQRCTSSGGLQRLRRAGLFGDTWLTCEVTAPASLTAEQRNERLDTWCAQVVAALAS